jgi:hypothetical protein
LLFYNASVAVICALFAVFSTEVNLADNVFIFCSLTYLNSLNTDLSNFESKFELIVLILVSLINTAVRIYVNEASVKRFSVFWFINSVNDWFKLLIAVSV